MDLVEILNKQNEYTGSIKKRNELVDGEYRNLIHLWIIDDEGKILIQRRSKEKKHYPNKWSITSGCVNNKETFVETCIREAKEELNIDIEVNNLEYYMSFKKKPTIAQIFVLRQNVDLEKIIVQKEEVSEVRLVTKNELIELINNNECANTINYMNLLFDILDEKIG